MEPVHPIPVAEELVVPRRLEFALTRWRGEPLETAETRLELRVRYAETDQMGIVYHSNYFVWYEMGRIDWLRRLEIDYSAIEAAGLKLPVIEVAGRYLGPARFDDQLTVVTRLVGMASAKVRFGYRLLAESGQLLAEAYSEHAAVDAAMRPTRLPDWLRERLIPRRTA